MSLRSTVAKWMIPMGFRQILRGPEKPKKDVNVNIDTIQLRHIIRYQFARKHLIGQKVLDAACGSGYGSELLDPVETYVGVDYADYCIEFAKDNFPAEHRTFIEGDIYLLNDRFPDSHFDAIISFETLEHVDHPDKVLAAFYKLLKPSGQLITSIPLNHPDLIYHKRQYTHREVLELLDDYISDHRFGMSEHLQRHLEISTISEVLPDEVKGTWLGILTKH